MSENRAPLDEAAITELLSSVDSPTMPEAVWARLQAALAVESANRSVAASSHPEPVLPEVDKTVMPESQPSALEEI